MFQQRSATYSRELSDDEQQRQSLSHVGSVGLHFDDCWLVSEQSTWA